MFAVYKKLLYYVPKQRPLAYIAIGLTVVSTLLNVGAYYYLYEFLKRLVVDGDMGHAQYNAFLVAGLLIGGSLLYFAAVLLTHMLGFRLETNLRKRGIDGLTNASFRYFDLNSSGKTRKLIDDNAAQTHSIVAHLIPDNAGAILTPFLALVVGFLISLRVGIVLLVLFLLSGVLLVLMTGEKKFMEVYQKALETMSSETVEYIRGIQVLKIFGIDATSFKTLHRAIADYARHALNYSMSCRRPYVLFQLILFGFIAVLVSVAALTLNRMQDPAVLAVELIMTLFLGGVMFTAFMKVMYVGMYAFMGTSAVEKLEQVFSDMQKDRLTFGNKSTFKNYDIEFERVCFGYTDQMVLEDVSFTLKEGRSYALVGSSGGGKSTIAKLISSFYKVDGGAVKIGGEPIEAYTEDALIRNIAFVFQNVRLFHISIYENVRLANPDAQRTEVMEALHQAGCDSILDKFKDRENTVIGSKGVYLSGGEKQRIAIARAMLKNAKIVILDEASAAIDPENEHELQKAFAHLMKGKTVIMIAHRLSSIRNVDEILVLEDGKIAERGTDAALMATDTKYREYQTLYEQANEWRVVR